MIKLSSILFMSCLISSALALPTTAVENQSLIEARDLSILTVWTGQFQTGLSQKFSGRGCRNLAPNITAVNSITSEEGPDFVVFFFKGQGCVEANRLVGPFNGSRNIPNLAAGSVNIVFRNSVQTSADNEARSVVEEGANLEARAPTILTVWTGQFQTGRSQKLSGSGCQTLALNITAVNSITSEEGPDFIVFFYKGQGCVKANRLVGPFNGSRNIPNLAAGSVKILFRNSIQTRADNGAHSVVEEGANLEARADNLEARSVVEEGATLEARAATILTVWTGQFQRGRSQKLSGSGCKSLNIFVVNSITSEEGPNFVVFFYKGKGCIKANLLPGPFNGSRNIPSVAAGSVRIVYK